VAREVLDRARVRGLPHVVALIHAENVASLAVARKVGLARETAFHTPEGVPVLQDGAILHERESSLATRVAPR
jgi:RimJ/RimL family protein N-acetyltransferase